MSYTKLKKYYLNISLNNLMYIKGLPVSVLGTNRVYYSTDKERLEGIDWEKIYLNADKYKLDILNENNGKSGIYL
jgi:hypothetical protein